MQKEILVTVFPGTNCERETADWLATNLEVNVRLVKGQDDSASFVATHLPAAVVLPGGFSFGDYLRAGALAARLPFIRHLKKWAENNVPILGICNGFQILCEARLLPGTLTKNKNGQHLHKAVSLTLQTGHKNPWLLPTQLASPSLKAELEHLRLPISCGMGRFVPSSHSPDSCYVALRYVENEVGSFDGIAAIAKGSVLGMMPHPERASDCIIGCDLGLTFLVSLARAQNLQVRPQSRLAAFIDKHNLYRSLQC